MRCSNWIADGLDSPCWLDERIVTLAARRQPPPTHFREEVERGRLSIGPRAKPTPCPRTGVALAALARVTYVQDVGGARLELLGRGAEQRQIGSLLSAARNGRGGALLVVGEPGIGKTSLLQSATADPTGMHVLAVDGYEAESTIPFAAVQRLIIPLRSNLASLPERHQRALNVAAGAADGPPPDRFLVGLGVLGLLALAADPRPIVCSVDDAHHVDPESMDVLTFVARRVEAESVVLLFAGRDDEGLETRFSGVPVLPLRGLEAESAISLLNTSLAAPLDPAAAARIARATGGNPLALVDLTRDLSVSELVEFGLADVPIPVGRHLEEHYARRLRAAGTDAQRWMLLAP